jgi:malonate transporter
MSFSNTLQLGIPVVSAFFGTAGLALLIAIISLRALVLLTTSTVVVEADPARNRGRQPGDGSARWRAMASAVRRTVRQPAGRRGQPDRADHPRRLHLLRHPQ